MIRYTFLVLFLVGVAITGLRNWFAAACALLFLTVFAQHPSMPGRLMEIPGANPWNLVVVLIFAGWVSQRRNDPRGAPIPKVMVVLLVAYVMMVIAAGLVPIVRPETILNAWKIGIQPTDLLINTMIDPLKFVVIGVLFFDGAKTRARIRWTLYSIVGSSMLYGLMMFKTIGPRILHIDFEDARRLTDKLVGLYANDMAELMAFTIWAAVAISFILPTWVLKTTNILGAAVSLVPFEALKSRAGYLAFGAAGIALGVLRWRKILIALPIGVAIAIVALPDLRDRIFTGVGEQGGADWNEVSAGRMTHIWPACIRQISRDPLIGVGRYAIRRTEACYEIQAAEGVVPTHPHCMYLEILMDCGVVGLAICLTAYWGIFRASRTLMVLKGDPLIRTLGTCAVIAMVCELSAGIAGSSFFPSQSKLPFLCLWGTALRAALELKQRPVEFQEALRHESPAALGGAFVPA
ncbi:MAG: O-antigen ligase family protein [Phycisphaerae bacterium]